jgi:arylsulfatase A
VSGLLAALLALGACASAGRGADALDDGAEAGQRNGPTGIVVIYADDLGYGDVACFGGETSRIPTPRLDALAAEGLAFTDAHSSSGVCSPSRYTLLTGRYHWRTRLQKGIVGLWEPPLIAADRPTIGTLAQRAGWRTAAVGKWHLGWDWPLQEGDRALLVGPKQGAEATDAHRDAWSRIFGQPLAGGPITRGFDRYFGTDVPNWPPYCFIRDDRAVGVPSAFADAALFAKNQASQQGPALPGWTLEPILPALTDAAVAFVEECAEADEPFLLYFSLTSPHTPLAVNEEFRGSSGLGVYGDFVVETDAAVGRLVDALEASGRADDTLVVFTSDNGFAHYAGKAELESQGHFPSGPFRGSKADAWEGGHRVPFVVRWPGRVEAGTRSDALVHQADLFRTVADVLGQTAEGLDGEELGGEELGGEDSWSLLPLLEGQTWNGRTTSISTSIRGVPSYRIGRWKLIPAPGSGGWTKGRGPEEVQLYDLRQDPGEQNNLASQKPDRVRNLARALEHEIARGSSTLGAPSANDGEVVRYPIGAQ